MGLPTPRTVRSRHIRLLWTGSLPHRSHSMRRNHDGESAQLAAVGRQTRRIRSGR